MFSYSPLAYSLLFGNFLFFSKQVVTHTQKLRRVKSVIKGHKLYTRITGLEREPFVEMIRVEWFDWFYRWYYVRIVYGRDIN
jgi:hypothetical protein